MTGGPHIARTAARTAAHGDRFWRADGGNPSGIGAHYHIMAARAA